MTVATGCCESDHIVCASWGGGGCKEQVQDSLVGSVLALNHQSLPVLEVWGCIIMFTKSFRDRQ